MESTNTQLCVDLIVFGASGFTGKRIVQILQQITSKEEKLVKWGIAGRNFQKLQEVLNQLENETGKNFQNIPIFMADTDDEISLQEMASKCRVIINCTGPYKYHGEPVIQACIRQKCHYIDVNAEALFFEKMKLEYEEEAVKNCVYIVPGCGLDSLINDVGLDFLQKNFQGTLNSVESYFEVIFKDGSFFGVINRGTWHSMLVVLQEKSELEKIKKKIFDEKLPKVKPKQSLKRFPHKVPMSGNLACPFPGPDATIMAHSQLYLYEKHQSRPVQIQTYISTSKYWHTFLLYFAYPFLCLFSRFNCIRNLFVKYPRLFSCGIFTEGPQLETTKNCTIVMTLYGKGWKSKVDEHHQEPEDSWIVAKIRKDDGYDLTAISAVSAALVMLDGSQKVPEMGGAYTPATFYTDTNLIDLLQKNGVTFEISGQGYL